MSRHARGWMALALCLLVGASPMAQAAAPVIAVRLVMTDVQGTPVMKKDLQGHILARYDYRPYGAQQGGPVQAGPGYTGHVNDPQTELVYMQQRYYDPGARFLSVDPIGPTPGNVFNFNRYAYANDNPTIFTDPWGLQANDQGGFESPCSAACMRMRRTSEQFNGSINQNTVPRDIDSKDRTEALYATAKYFKINVNGVQLIYSPGFTGAAETLPNGNSFYGPRAFAGSIGDLGSTLFHEIVGHYRLQDLKGFVSVRGQALYMREVQAYDLQLTPENIKRFNLTPQEVDSIRTLRAGYFNLLTPWRKDLVLQGIYRAAEDY